MHKTIFGRSFLYNSQNNFHSGVGKTKVKGKAIPVTSSGGPKSCETSRFPYFPDNRPIDGCEVVSLKRRPPSPQEDS
jgi:hypothetical protein